MEKIFSSILAGILSGGVAGAALVWLLRTWISERLQQSIRYEYSQKLETHKAELNTRIQSIQHESQLQQLRTSLFFDHQREAFASILTEIAELNRAWLDKNYDPDEGWTGPVPTEGYRSLWTKYYQNQLFLDSGCLAALNLILSCYRDSFPVEDGSGQCHPGNVDEAYDAVEYLQPRLAELFQNRIGVSTSRRAEREIALYGAIRLLNHYRFSEIGLPPEGALELTRRDQPAEAVLKAQSHIQVLVAKLRELLAYLEEDGGFFHEAATNATRYLEIISSGAETTLSVGDCSS